MSLEIIDWLKAGTKANYADSFRRGNLINLPPDGSVVVGGDIHGHCRNFERILNYARLKDNTDRHLVLQEIIHSQQDDKNDNSFSFDLLAEAARLKSEFPNRVHIVMGNHRSEEHTSELQSHSFISYAVFCLKKKNRQY